MSELPIYITSSETRRRHHNIEIKTNNNPESDFSNAGESVNSYYFQQQFGNFSSLIAPASNKLWNAAQSSIQLFADQITDFSTEQRNQQFNNTSEIKDFEVITAPIEMPFHDRTAEFRTVAKSCQFRHQPNGNLLEAKGEREKILQSSIHFNQLAKRIGRDLSMTCAKMEKLSQLAKNKSLFDDRASEIEELSQTIKQDITGLNKQIANLQQVALQRSGPKSNLTKNEQQGQNHSKLVVVGLQSKLASISKTFKNVLEIRTENLKLKRARREKFSQSTVIPSSLPPSASNGNMGSLLLYDDMAASSGSSSFTLDMDRLEQHRIQDQVALIDETDTYHRARYSAMEGIESSIAELGTIFRQLASLVSEQGEMITR